MMAQPSEQEVHGTKRAAEGELDDQPLAKKFGRLRIGPSAATRLPQNREGGAQLEPKLNRFNDSMMLDDTKTTIYVHDLEQELAENEILDGTFKILPGLEDRLSMSRMLVTSPKPHCNELVLYREPESLSISKDKDLVRRALIETRERARLGHLTQQHSVEEKAGSLGAKPNHGTNSNHEQQQYDDMMDVDTEPGT